MLSRQNCPSRATWAELGTQLTRGSPVRGHVSEPVHVPSRSKPMLCHAFGSRVPFSSREPMRIDATAMKMGSTLGAALGGGRSSGRGTPALKHPSESARDHQPTPFLAVVPASAGGSSSETS